MPKLPMDQRGSRGMLTMCHNKAPSYIMVCVHSDNANSCHDFDTFPHFYNPTLSDPELHADTFDHFVCSFPNPIEYI